MEKIRELVISTMETTERNFETVARYVPSRVRSKDMEAVEFLKAVGASVRPAVAVFCLSAHSLALRDRM